MYRVPQSWNCVSDMSLLWQSSHSDHGCTFKLASRIIGRNFQPHSNWTCIFYCRQFTAAHWCSSILNQVCCDVFFILLKMAPINIFISIKDLKCNVYDVTHSDEHRELAQSFIWWNWICLCCLFCCPNMANLINACLNFVCIMGWRGNQPVQRKCSAVTSHLLKVLTFSTTSRRTAESWHQALVCLLKFYSQGVICVFIKLSFLTFDGSSRSMGPLRLSVNRRINLERSTSYRLLYVDPNFLSTGVSQHGGVSPSLRPWSRVWDTFHHWFSPLPSWADLHI